MTRVALLVAAVFCAGQAVADDGALTAALTACASPDAGFEAATAPLRDAGWAQAEGASLDRLAKAMAVSPTLYDHLDGDAQTAQATHGKETLGYTDIIRKSIAKTEAPFDTMNISILTSPDGVILELNWSEIALGDAKKIYLSCRLALPEATTLDAASAVIETVFTDPYMERSDKSGSNGTRAEWKDFDNEQIYLDALAPGIGGDKARLSITTVISPEG